MEGLYSSLYQIVRHGLNTNSYKFALLCALVRLAPDTDPKNPVIAIADLAPVFVDLYWPLEVSYHLRQGTDPDKDPIVMVEIRRLMQQQLITHGMSLAEFKKRNPDSYLKLVGKVERKAFSYVISCFHTVRKNKVEPDFFTHTADSGKSGGMIVLTKEARQFLINEGKLIEYVAVAGWAKFTEGFSYSPKLITKLSGDEPQRGNVSRWRPVLEKLQSGKCFYCSTTNMLNPHVDHALPWSFMLEDKTWNLVLACGDCNGSKSDLLPSSDDIEQLVERNLQLLKGNLAVSDGTFLRSFSDWHTRDLGAHIRSLYDQAASDQYPIWSIRT